MKNNKSNSLQEKGDHEEPGPVMNNLSEAVEFTLSLVPASA